ncbi:MAG: SMP-30/gluconolactonase/LRE family protein [Bacteroidales bacterium]|nr:SMP-30/gluconolactonase/LRE family protein [Bacteroidales bacterium]
MLLRLTDSLTFFVLIIVLNVVSANDNSGKSFYTRKLIDEEAVYFTSENFNISNDGKTDITSELQRAINELKQNKNFGIIFIPEGTYKISRTIYIPKAIRLIGYGENRPVFILDENTPGYQTADSTDKGKANYMFWFTSRLVEPGKDIDDANAGTFYSALSNINIKIEKGNPEAVALRTHFAQHSYISYCDIDIGGGKAGIFDAGNLIEEVRFFGGDYGIYTTKTSPGWQFMMLDTYFEGQRKAAIKTQEAGLTIVRMEVKNVPVVIDINPNYWEKLYMEDCRLHSVKESAVNISNEGNANSQISLINISCKNVPVLATYRRSGRQVKGEGNIYRVKCFIDGLHIDNLSARPEIKTISEIESLEIFPAAEIRDIPDFPPVKEWVNLKELGAKGDNESDDTKILQEAIDKYQTIYIPQGWYIISETLKLKTNTVIIGLSPIATQLIIKDNTESFGGFGPPKPLIEAPEGGSNIISGIGLSTGIHNYRAVACKWMAGANSYMNDVKFLGGHGDMDRGPFKPRDWSAWRNRIVPITDPGWDSQYWSLWITNNGGGIFQNIWTASTFATNGLYVSNTSTRGRIYAMSVEHHMRNEVRFKNVSNWKSYALQLEEEDRESYWCQPVELDNCRNVLFANFYTFRTIRLKTPYPYSVRTWNCTGVEFLNVHNYAQIKYTTDNPLYDINTGIEIRPWEFVRLYIEGENYENPVSKDKVVMLAKGFEFAEGSCSDSKGNVYFCEHRLRRIYKWSVETNSLSLIADFPWKPLSLACDNEDNLLVVFRYDPQPGLIINGEPEVFENPPDAAGSSFSGWGNSGFGTLVYSIDPENPDETMQLLRKVPMNTVTDIHKALYPSNRWRDSHDFNEIVVAKNEECWLAPDGVTVIPVCYDLARCCALIEAYPGKPLYATDEYDKRVVKLSVDKRGYLSNPEYFAEKGEFSTAVDNHGNLYIADGDIYVFNNKGDLINEIIVPERPTTITFGGKERKTLFITGREAFYATEID